MKKSSVISAALWPNAQRIPAEKMSMWLYAVLFALCVASRLFSTIFYIEDTDSLRFALAVLDYDIVRLQPHFPGYPVYCFLAKILYTLTGSFAVSFSILGGCAVFALCVVLVKLGAITGLCADFSDMFRSSDIADKRKTLCSGIVLLMVFFNPLLWLMSNRYMPDLCGAACALAALYFLIAPVGRTYVGFGLCGLLCGIRLSYVPFIVVPFVVALAASAKCGTLKRDMLALVVAVAIWLLPLIIITGLPELVQAAATQTEGHFTDFGGTIITEGTPVARFAHTLETLVVDGLGVYLPGRNPMTILTTVGIICGFAIGLAHVRRDRQTMILIASWLVYFFWILLFQNVLHKNRHVLPLIPPLLLIIAIGYAVVFRRVATAIPAAATLLCYAAVALVLVGQHRRPTAIAQVKNYIERRGGDSLTIVAAPLVNYYLSGQRVRAVYIAADDPRAAERIRARSGSPVVSVGNYEHLVGQPASGTRTFYHNPYVNRMWPEITVFEFE